ncbi:MAG: hypothetical protein ACP5M9_03465 [Candidatus Micrarchaeia archaeon]
MEKIIPPNGNNKEINIKHQPDINHLKSMKSIREEMQRRNKTEKHLIKKASNTRDQKLLKELLKHESPKVRKKAASNPEISLDTLCEFLINGSEKNIEVKRAAEENYKTKEFIIDEIQIAILKRDLEEENF